MKRNEEIKNTKNTENRKEEALQAAHDLFDLYCEQALMADAMLEAPEDFVDDYGFSTEDEVLLAAEDILGDSDGLLETAKELWMVSTGWNDVNNGRAEMLS